jgi:hypothetical protein
MRRITLLLLLALSVLVPLSLCEPPSNPAQAAAQENVRQVNLNADYRAAGQAGRDYSRDRAAAVRKRRLP